MTPAPVLSAVEGPAPLPVAPPSAKEPPPITIFIYDSPPLARAIRQAYIDNPAYRVESKWLPGGVQRLDVWKLGVPQ